MADNVVKIDIQMVEKAAVNSLRKLTNETKKFEGKAVASFKAVSQSFDFFKALIASHVILKGFQMLSAAVSVAKEDFIGLTGAIAEVNSILPETGKLTEENKRKFIEFSSAYGGKPQEQAKAFYQIVSAGITDTAQAMDVLAVSNKAATAGISDMETAADALTSVMATYGQSGTTATQASDILFTSIREGKTTFSELGANIGKVAPIAASAGVKFSELTGTLAFLTKVGLSTDEASTGLRATITALLKPGEDSKKTFESLGIAYGESGLKAHGLAGILEQVKEKTGGNVDMITKLFPNVRALGSVLAVTKGNFSDYNRILGETANATGATDKAFKVVTDSVEFQQKKFMQSLQNVPTAFLMFFEKPILSALKAMNNFVSGLKDIEYYLSKAQIFYQQNKIAIEAYAKGFAMAVSALTAYVAVVNAAKIATVAFNLVTKLTPWGIAITAVGLLSAAFGYLIQHWDKSIAQMKVFGGTILDYLITPIQFAAEKIAGLVGVFNEDLANSLLAQVENLKLFKDELIETGTVEGELAVQAEEEAQAKQNRIVQEMEAKEKARQADIKGQANLNKKMSELDKKKDIENIKNKKENDKILLEYSKSQAQLEQGLKEAARKTDVDNKEKDLLVSKIAEDKNFKFIQDNLSRREAAQLAYEVERLNNAGKHKEALKLIQDNYAKANAKYLEKLDREEKIAADRRAKHNYVGGAAIMKMQDAFNNEQVRSTLNTNNQLMALQNSKNSKLAAIGKAAALIRIAQETAQGAISAYSSLAGIPIVGPVLGALAAGALIAYGLERANEVRQSFQEGGIVSGNSFTGDNVRVGVNSGEMILNKSQQANLFDMASKGQGDQVDNALLETILNQPIIVEVDGIEIARAVRDAQESGFVMQGA